MPMLAWRQPRRARPERLPGAALLAAAALALPLQAQAILLVGNVNQGTTNITGGPGLDFETTDDSHVDPNVGQSFKTGSNAHGYLLEDVEIFLGGVATFAGEDIPTVQICNVSKVSISGSTVRVADTGNCIATLNPPSSVTSNDASATTGNVFTAPGGALRLAAETDYAVYFSGMGGWGAPDGRLDVQSGTGEDSGGATGWTIRNTYQTRSGGIWSNPTTQRPLKIKVNGSLRTAPPLLLGNATGTTDTSIGPGVGFDENDPDVSQEFTTGDNAAGYLLQDVEIFISGTFFDQTDLATVSVCPLVGGDPDTGNCTELTSLTSRYDGVDSATATVGRAYTAPADHTLSASTTYSLYIAGASSFGRLHVVTSSTRDSGSLAGWELASTYQTLTSGTWSDPNSNAHPIKVKINGTAKSGMTTPMPQTSVLVGNVMQMAADGPDAGHPNGVDESYSQAFTTGPNPGDYLLESIETFSNSVNTTNGQPYHRVSVCAVDANGDADTGSCTALTAPLGTKDGMQVPAVAGQSVTGGFLDLDHSATTGNVFTAPAGHALSASTTYALYIIADGTVGGNELHVVASGTEDTGRADGWSLADTYRETGDSGATWSNPSTPRPLKVKINGRVRTATDLPMQIPVLIGNLGQTVSPGTTVVDETVSQEFTTGPNMAGYLLRSVEVHTDGDRAIAASICDLDGSGDPDTDNCAPLTPPDSFADEGMHTFTASPGVTLSRSTTYSLYLTGTATGNEYFEITTDDEDDGGADGWSLANVYQVLNGSWADHSSGNSLKVGLRGTVNSGGGDSAPVSANAAVTTAQDTTYTFKASDFPFADADGDALASVQIVSLATAGELKFDDSDEEVLGLAVLASEIVSLRFIPAAGASGSPYATFRFRVVDSSTGNLLSMTHTMTINVTPAAPQTSLLVGNVESMVAVEGGVPVGPDLHDGGFHSQEFTTGSNPGGAYLLESVEVFSRGIKARYDVSVCALSNGDPDTDDCTALTRPTLFATLATDATSGNVFTAPESTVLSASTTYSLYLVGAGTTGSAHLVTTGDQDSGSQTGWELADTYQSRQSGTMMWLDPTPPRPIKVKINGRASSVAPGITNFGISSTPRYWRQASGSEDPNVRDLYGAGDAITFTATFDAPVVVTGDPQVVFSMGMNINAAYDAARSAAAGPNQVVFAYTVQAADVDADGIFQYISSATSGLILLDSDDRIATSDGVAADLTWLDGLGRKPEHKVDGARAGPAPASLEVTSTAPLSNDEYGVGDVIEFTLTMDRDVTVTGAPELEFDLGGSNRAAQYAISRSTARTLVFVYFVAAADMDADGIFLPDGRDFSSRDSAVRLRFGESIRDRATNEDADLVTPSRGIQSAHKVDGSRDGGDADPAPTASDQTVTIDEDATYAFDAADFGFVPANAGDELASVRIATLESAGELKLDGADVTLNQVVARTDINADRFTFAPAANANGRGYASFGFQVNDGTNDSILAYAMTLDVTAVDEAPPGTPTVTAPTDTVDQLEVTWTAPENPAPPVTDYDVQYCQGMEAECDDTFTDEVLFSSAGVTITGTTATITGLMRNTLYQVRVRAHNGRNSDWATGEGTTGNRSAPTSANATVTIDEDTTRTFSAADFPFEDLDGGTLAGVAITSLATAGTLRYDNADVASADLPRAISIADIGQLQFVPDANGNGSPYATFAFRVNDGTTDSPIYTMTINVTPTPDPPSAPDTPTVEPTRDALDSLDVSWSAPANVGPQITDYDVQHCRGTATDCALPTADFMDVVFSGTGTSTTITGLAEGELYQVRVRASNSDGAGDWSSPFGEGRTNANDAPEFAAATLSLTFDENTMADEPVGAPIPAASDDPGDTLTYSMEGTDMSSFDFDAANRRIRTTGAGYDFESTPTYEVVIRVVDNFGAADTLAVTIHLDDVDEPPSAPAPPLVGATPGETTSLDVSWSAPVDAGRPAVTGYGVRWCAGAPTDCDDPATDFLAANSLSVTVASATITGLTESTEYQVQVQATNHEGTGPWSDSGPGRTNTPGNEAPVFADDALMRDVPENSPAGTSVGPAIPTASDANTADTLTYAMVGADADFFAFDALQISTAANVSYDHEARAAYTVTIAVRDGEGGVDTVPVTISITDVEEPPSAPGAPTVAPGSSTSLDVSWTAPANTGPAITDYSVRWCAGAAADCGQETDFDGNLLSATTPSATIAGLAPDTLYQVQVQASNDEGAGPWSVSGEGSTEPNNVPMFPTQPPPRDIPENSPAGTLVGDRIPAATDADGDALTYSMIGGADAAAFDFDAATRQISTISDAGYDFETKSSYTVTIQAADGRGGTGTAPVTIRLTNVDEPPSAPAAPAVAATPGTSTSLDVSWSAPVDAGRPAVTGYAVRWCAGAAADCDFAGNILSVTVASATLAGLAADTAYQVQVRADNAEGMSLWSASGSGRTGRPPNRAPAFAEAALTRSIPENSAAGANVGAAIPAAADADGDVLAYSMGGADAASFSFDAATRQIRTAAGVDYDYATKSSYTVTIRADDGRGGADTASVTIRLTPAPVPDDVSEAWLARFGRTVAGQMVEAVGTRLDAPAAPQAQLSLGGAAPQAAALSGVFRMLSGKTVVDAKQALAKSAFALPLADADGARWIAWGRGAHTDFEGEENDVDLDGEVATGTVGVDRAHGDWLVGVAASRSEGDGDSRNRDGERGEMDVSLSTVSPYARVDMGGGLSAWSMAGFGDGDLERTLGGVDTEVDLEMRMAAIGIEGPVGTVRGVAGDFGLRLKADALAVRMEADGEADLPEVESDVQRLRLLLSGAGRQALELGGTLQPSLEAGLRWDEGDAETGLGFEMGAGMRFADAGGRFGAELKARALVAHEESGYDEWGVGGSAVLAPERHGRGLSLKLESGYGPVASGTQQLWSRRNVAGLAPAAPIEFAGHLGLELGYGLNGPGGRGAWMPYLAYQEGGAAELRVGTRLDLDEALRLEFSALRRGRERRDIGFQLQGRW